MHVLVISNTLFMFESFPNKSEDPNSRPEGDPEDPETWELEPEEEELDDLGQPIPKPEKKDDVWAHERPDDDEKERRNKRRRGK